MRATIVQSRIDAVRLPGARGTEYAQRLTTIYRFTLAGSDYSGRSVSWYPRSDVRALREGESISVHYDARQPASNGLFTAPRFTVWIESLAAVMLLLMSGLPWHRWRAHRTAALEDDDPDSLPAVTLQVSPDGRATPSPSSLMRTITRVGG